MERNNEVDMLLVVVVVVWRINEHMLNVAVDCMMVLMAKCVMEYVFVRVEVIL